MSDGKITFTVTRTKADYFSAVLSSFARNGKTWVIYGCGALVVALLATVAAEPEDRIGTFAFAFVAMALLYGAIIMFCIWAATAKNWTTPGAFAPISFTFSPDGIGVVGENASGESKWALWKSAFETKRLIVVRHHLGLVQFAPKRDLTADTVQRLRALLRTMLPGKAWLWEAP